MDEAAQTDRVMVIDGGKLVLEGTPRNVFAKTEILRKAGMDIPQVSSVYIEAVKEGIIHGGQIPILLDEAKEIFSNLSFASKNHELPPECQDKVMKEEKVIEIRNLSYIYMPNTPYEKQALKNVSLDVYRGVILGIIGHTGSGKSTLIQHLNGLLTPTDGTINISGIIPKERH